MKPPPPMRAVDFESLLDEMVDRDALPRTPVHNYTLGQASSYDRRSVSPDQPGWYANRDGGGIVRVETNQGRTERVLMDERGPGAIVRFWSTYLTWAFTNGTLRFYFDGADIPQIQGAFADIVAGAHLVDGVLAQSTGGFLENGHILAGRNLYLPLPYATGCKVTYEGPDDPFYFAINFRRYAGGTVVRTFSMDDLRRHGAKLVAVQRELQEEPRVLPGTERTSIRDQTIPPEQSVTLNLIGERAIRRLILRLDAGDYRQALRSTVLEITFDGKQTVWVPVGDFFGTGYKIAPYESRYHRVTLDGRMLSRWVMPFQRGAKVTVHNYGKQLVALREFELHHTPWRWGTDGRSLYFHAAWRLYPDAPSARGRDTNYVIIQGQGKYVGDSLAIFNGVTGDEHQPWWGEGDEKIYVDGETFPSNFGTGTEDYYGYAWVGVAPFSQPFLAQPRGQGNRGRGLTTVSRWRALDAMPFRTSFKLDMEIWHWARGVTVDYAPTTFWYGTLQARPVVDRGAKPGVERPNDLSGARRLVRSVDRIEAEGMVVEAGQPGTAVVHTIPNDKRLSGRSYLLLRRLSAGDTIQAAFHADKESTGTLKLVFVHSRESMIVDLLLNGRPVIEGLDLHGGNPAPVPRQVPGVALRKGANQLTVRARGTNPNNPGAHEVGIDYLQLLTVD